MKGLTNRTLLILGLVVFNGQILLSHSAWAQSSEADELVDRLRAKYEAIDGLEASFTQTMRSEFLDAPESSAGRVVLSGKKIRIETAVQTFVTDGQVTWLYDSNAGEVLINDYVEEEMFPVREFLFDYDSTYEVLRVEDGAGVKVVHLRARDESTPYKEISISVRNTDDVINRLVILDVNETEMEFVLDDVVLNPDLDAATFAFTPPTDVEVIDLRS